MHLQVEQFEERAVPATLTVTGTAARDVISVNNYRPEATTVTGADTVVGVPQNLDGTYTLSPGDVIVVRGMAGDDVIRVTGYLDTVLRGGAGNDYIYGGYGNDVIFGGAGNDYVRGGLGNDLIIGRDGRDYLYGDAGNDVIVGGLFDETGLNNAALLALVNDPAAVAARSSDDGDVDILADSSGADNFVYSVGDRLFGAGVDDTLWLV